MNKPRPAIFIGGPVHLDAENKRKLADSVRRIEKLIQDRKLKFHPHFLSELKVLKGLQPATNDLKLGTHTFEKLMKAVPKSQLRRLKRVRFYETEDRLLRCITVGSILEQQIAASIAGIFLFTEASPGSNLLIGLLLARQIPVLAVSDQNNQDVFGTVLTGHPSEFLRTAHYDTIAGLEKIVGEFLDSLEGLRLQPTSVRLPRVLKKRAEMEAADSGTNFPEILIRALNEYLERREAAEEE